LSLWSKFTINKLKRVGWTLCIRIVHPLTFYCRWHYSFFFKGFAINLRGKYMRWTLCSHTVHSFMFYHERHCSFFFRFAINLKGKKILNLVEFMVEIHSTSFTMDDTVYFFCLFKICYKFKGKHYWNWLSLWSGSLFFF